MKFIITKIHKPNGNVDVTCKGFYALTFINTMVRAKQHRYF